MISEEVLIKYLKQMENGEVPPVILSILNAGNKNLVDRLTERLVNMH